MPPEDTWSIATAESGGKPLVLRIRNQPPAFARKEEFPHLLAVVWQYEPPNEHGMPSAEVLAGMDQLEDVLTEAFEGAGQAFLTATVTGSGVREWQWYARNPDDLMKLVNRTLAGQAQLPIQFSFQDDPDWAGYAQFVNIVAPGESDDPGAPDGE